MSPRRVVIEICSSSDDEEDLKTLSVKIAEITKMNTAMKDENKRKTKKKWREYMEDDDECVILDFDPFHSIDVSKKLNITHHQELVIDNNDKDKDKDKGKDEDEDEDEDEISVIAERGQVACRDYPHSRHQCAKFPFSSTPRESHCEQCYCYVCDKKAPCKDWLASPPLLKHCNATEHDPVWLAERKNSRQKSSL